MDFNKIIEEIKLLNQFNLNSKLYGIKIHQSNALPETVNAATRLYEKGLIDHIDGGYLTDLGVETAETRSNTSSNSERLAYKNYFFAQSLVEKFS